MSVTITTGGKTITRTGVKHALHTAIGNVTLSPDVQTTTPSVAFSRVVEQLLLRVLQDMQTSGELTWLSIFVPVITAALSEDSII